MTKHLITIFVDDARLNLSLSQEAEDSKHILEDSSRDPPQHQKGRGGRLLCRGDGVAGRMAPGRADGWAAVEGPGPPLLTPSGPCHMPPPLAHQTSNLSLQDGLSPLGRSPD